jgi:MoxR-like ATPase
VALGVSQRGAIALLRTGKTLAASRGRHFVIPDDIKALAEAALAHRLIIKTSSSMHDIDPRQVITELLNSVPVEAASQGGGVRSGVSSIRAGAEAAKRAAGSPAR